MYTSSLFFEIFNYLNLIRAFDKMKLSKHQDNRMFCFTNCIGIVINDILIKVHNGTYEIQPYNIFHRRENNKIRMIHAPHIYDLLIQHSIYIQIYAILDKCLIKETHGCRVGHGCESTMKYIKHRIRYLPDDSYYLQLDIRRYFYNIDHEILRKMLLKRLKDKVIVDMIIKYSSIDNSGVGVPLGNLLSQLVGLFYLSKLDHFITRKLKCKSYCRYVDDFIIIGLTKEQAYKYKLLIEEFLAKELKLKLSKYKINKIKNGMNFSGYRIWKYKVLIRRYIIKRIRKVCKENQLEPLISYLGHCILTSSKSYIIKVIKQFDIINQIPKKLLRRYNYEVF